ncbi:MAG: mercury methylation corrinoid protein HgcA [candidate division WOR-3 bacterium]
MVGALETTVGVVPKVSSSLTFADRLGTFKARWGVGRMRYKIDPGLYALGEPDAESPVLVSANYKMSFDRLREALRGRAAWILVLDTDGINVWCAAGKGTFGTDELVDRIMASRLAELVSHRRLILPQLGAPGVAAHLVRKRSGFKVIYGPVRAKDLPAFLDGGMRATPAMRTKTFDIWERTVLVPVELVIALKTVAIIAPILFLISALMRPVAFWPSGVAHGLYSVLGFLMAVAAGTVFAPVLLPWLPGRAFSVKGLTLGLACAVIWAVLRWETGATWAGRVEMIAWFLMSPSVAAFLAMNFTGASTYTSLSGVKKEMRVALPLQIGGCAVGLILWFTALGMGMGG